MPRFTSSPPASGAGLTLQLVRCPDSKPVRGIITSHEVIGCNTHYFGGRTIPCEPEDCPACAAGVSYRWHAYLGLWFPAQYRHVIFELTAMPAQTLIDHHRAHGSIRNTVMEASRPGLRKNGRVYIALKPNDNAELIPPPEPDVLTMLCRIWSLPTAAIETARLQWGARTIAIDQTTLTDTRTHTPPDPPDAKGNTAKTRRTA